MYWLIVERPENWETDRKNHFSYFGISQSKQKMASNVSVGDKLIVYVSGGVSCFSDMRLVESGDFIRLRGLSGYDDIFPLAIKTKPLVTLPKEYWVPVKSLVSQLTFTRALTDWRQAFRSSMRRLDESDGALLEHALNGSLMKLKTATK